MSRVGNKPVPIPKGVTVTVGNEVKVVKGKSALSQSVVDGVSVAVENDTVIVSRSTDSRPHRANHGLMRALIANMIHGVDKGFERTLEIVGVGYKAEVKGKELVLNLGYSHLVHHPIPEGIQILVEKGKQMPSYRIENFVTIKGIDKQAVGQTAATIRSYRSPDSYKGKGVRYQGETIRLKAGKSAKK